MTKKERKSRTANRPPMLLLPAPGSVVMRVKFRFGMERIHEGLDEESRGQISVDARMRADQLARIHMRRHQQKSLRRKSHPSAAPRRAGTGRSVGTRSRPLRRRL